MWTKKLHLLTDGDGWTVPGKRQSTLRRVCIVTGRKSEEAIRLAAADVRKYIQLACPATQVAMLRDNRVSADDLQHASLILMGNAEDNELIRQVRQTAKLKARATYEDRYRIITGVELKDPGAGFSIHTVPSPFAADQIAILLEGDDCLGVQYAAYDWLEEALGVRYLNPYVEYCPKRKQLSVPWLNFEETCNFPLRRLEAWGYPHSTGPDDAGLDSSKQAARKHIHTRFDRDNNDPWLWYENGLHGDVTLMTRCVDWLVKNKQNVITWLPEMFGHWPAEVSADYTRYEAMRGVKIMGYCGAGSVWLPLKHYETLYGDLSKSLCQTRDGESFHHPCFTKKLFWDILEREIAWYEKPENRVRQMVAFVLCNEEGNCAYPSYCMKDRPAVRCRYCGHIPNWKKWVAAMKKVGEMLQDRGWNVPVGRLDFGSASSGIPWDHDHRFGVQPQWDKKLIDHAPAKNSFFELRPAGDHTFEEQQHYWDMVNQRNHKHKLRLSIFKQGENILMMSSDLPIISPYFFKSRQHDFDRLSGDPVTFGHDVNLYTTRKLEWLKSLYSFHGQWKHDTDWETFVRAEMDHLFGKGVGVGVLTAMKAISRVLEQELLWKKTPVNHDVDSYRGIQTFFPYLVHLFINCSQHPIDLMDVRRKNGGVWTVAAAAPEEAHLKRRPYREFVDHDYLTVRQDMTHYLKLVEQCEKSLLAAGRRVKRNKAFFQDEVAYNFRGAIDFLGWRLRAVIAYCQVIEAEKHARAYDKPKTCAAMRDATSLMTRAAEGLARYWSTYGHKEETIPGSWGNASPAAETVEALLGVWRELENQTRQHSTNWNTPLIAYVNVNDRYPELFSNKMPVVGRKALP
ncbi:MAG: hypothetical protein IT440_09100 [Phycisphaeraceae bacterium]|nr:hypothetical protein [Phycisphaeraceae bacterium]